MATENCESCGHSCAPDNQSKKLDMSRALDYCRENGNEIDRYRLKALFENYIDDDYALKLLERFELDGGGFPVKMVPHGQFSLIETSRQLGIMVELDLTATPLFSRTSNFLLNMQKEDGSFDENPAIETGCQSAFYDNSDSEVSVSLTGEIIRLVARGMVRGHPAVKKGCQFILKHFNGDHIEGAKIASFLALSAIAWAEADNQEISHVLSSTTGEWASRETDPFMLGWFLDCMLEGFHREGVLICLRGLELSRNSGGYWQSEFYPDRNIDANITALRHLRWAGRW